MVTAENMPFDLGSCRRYGIRLLTGMLAVYPINSWYYPAPGGTVFGWPGRVHIYSYMSYKK